MLLIQKVSVSSPAFEAMSPALSKAPETFEPLLGGLIEGLSGKEGRSRG